MRTTILNQRNERDKLLSNTYIPRQMRQETAPLLASRQIKLITGPRRSGKSTEALLMLRGRRFAYLNFDDCRLLSLWDEDLVMRLLDEVYPSYEYLLLDEVQNLPDWDLWVSKLYRNGLNLVVTGSNARLLSSEMATALTGRYLQVEMFPFSLAEVALWSEASAAEVADDYLRLGGYPETLSARALTQSYLSTLFDSIVLKDVARRHRVRHISELNEMALYLLSNFCNPLSINDVSDAVGLSSVATAKKFMQYLAEPYLFFYLPRFNNKLRLMTKAPRKVYVVDNGFVSAKAFSLSDNLGRLLENQVFVELLRRGYSPERTLFYYRTRNDKEVDFVTRQGTQVESLIQVCYDLSNERTLRREVSALTEAAGELHCDRLLILTAHTRRTLESDGQKIEIIPINEY